MFKDHTVIQLHTSNGSWPKQVTNVFQSPLMDLHIFGIPENSRKKELNLWKLKITTLMESKSLSEPQLFKTVLKLQPNLSLVLNKEQSLSQIRNQRDQLKSTQDSVCKTDIWVQFIQSAETYNSQKSLWQWAIGVPRYGWMTWKLLW